MIALLQKPACIPTEWRSALENSVRIWRQGGSANHMAVVIDAMLQAGDTPILSLSGGELQLLKDCLPKEGFKNETDARI